MLHKRVYVIPKGTINPDTMALLQDKRDHCDESPYELVIREPCSPEVFEKNIDEFILDGGLRLCFRVRQLSQTLTLEQELYK